jgi:hypothetical protein
MSASDSTEKRSTHHPHFIPKMSIEIPSDSARQGEMGLNMLYVLGFGLAGAVFANAIILFYFTS